MTKSRKKKNYKLRRRVKRTIAALIMIMAVVVAAIPVENLGTTQAHENSSVPYPSSFTDETLTNLEGTYSGSEVTVQRISNNDLISAFKVKPNPTGTAGMISGPADEITNLTVNSNEYYGYRIIDENYKNTFYSIWGSKECKIEFVKNDAESLDIPLNSSVNVSNDGGVTTSPLVANEVKISIIDSNVANANDFSIGGGSNISSATCEYNKYNGSSISSKKLFTDYESNRLTDKITAINSYNEGAKNDINRIKELQKNLVDLGYLTTNELNEWNAIANKKSDYERDYQDNHKLSVPISDMNSDSDNDALSDVAEYIICNCYQIDNNDTLKNYSLERVGAYYIPKLNAVAPEVGQVNDADGYLVSGKLEIKGVASSAFDCSGSSDKDKISGVLVLPNTVEFIGDKAFIYTTKLTSVEIDDSKLQFIGNHAFESSMVNNFKFTAANSLLKTIGTQAFSKSKLQNIAVPNNVTTIGDACFEKTPLSSVEFLEGGIGNDTKVGKFAFYNCNELGSVNFANDRRINLGEGAFAIDTSTYTEGGSLNTFTFPERNTSIDKDYVLAGRKELSEVTWPASLTGNIPDHTLCECENLFLAKFPESAKQASYAPDKLFIDVLNPEFYVEGPEFSNNSGTDKSKPRKITWKAKSGCASNNYIVPYLYTDSAGNQHIEVGDKDKEYVATLVVTDQSGKKATMTGYSPIDSATIGSDPIPVRIPSPVAGYKVTAIGTGCFSNDIKDKIYKLIIPDDSVENIEAGAFQGMKGLQLVYLGDAVVSIGDNAFEGCDKLENVYFSQRQTALFDDSGDYWAGIHQIGNNAFKTNSDYLTFHGGINENYQPFILAMSEDGAKMIKGDRKICYRTDEYIDSDIDEYNTRDILGLYVMRNSNDGKATLIDYPHFQELDKTSEFIDKVIDNNENASLTNDEQDAITQSLEMWLPTAIQSIDSASFFANDSKNDEDFVYLERCYKQGTDTISTDTRDRSGIQVGAEFPSKNNVKKLYSENNYANDTNYQSAIGDEKVAIGGLYSGGFDEDGSGTAIFGKAYRGQTYVENHKSGNDYLYSMNSAGIERLPDYAFDSCENLTSIIFGDKLSQVGVLPFRDCKSLSGLYIPETNTNFLSKNMILYKNNGDDVKPSYEILECLEGRGKIGGNNIVGRDTDDLASPISSIAKNAFSNCTELTEIYLDSTQITELPLGCFDRCSKLRTLTTPESLGQINSKAFTNLGEGPLHIYIANKRCNIAIDAFDGDTQIIIHGKMYENESTGELSACYKSYKQILDKWKNEGKDRNETQIQFADQGNDYVEEFVDIDLKPIRSYKVTPKRHDDGTYTDDALTAEQIDVVTPPQEYTGLEFVDWMCRVDDSNGINVLRGTKAGDPAFTNIREDRMFIPRYKFSPSKVVPQGDEHTLNVINAEYAYITVDGNSNMVTTFPTSVKCGADILLMADTKNNEGKFLGWTVTCTNDEGDFTYLFTNASNISTGFQMPHLKNADSVVTITALFSDDAAECELEVINGNGSGFYQAGEVVTIAAYAPTDAKQVFSKWTADNASVGFAKASAATTTFVMPQLEVGGKVTVTANYKDSPSSSGGDTPGGNTPGGDTPGGDTPGGSTDTTKKYKVTVEKGSGGGEYKAGDTVNISAFAPDTSSKVFSKWTSATSGVGFANATSTTTSFIMPASDVTVTANYKTRSSDDDEDSDRGNSSSGRPGSGSTTNTVTNRPSSSTSTTGTTGTVTNTTNGNTTGNNNSNNNNGNKLYITKNGVSNKDVGSVSVDGSTDNFIVKISDSDEATAAVKEALTNKYGSLDGLAYFPMDISLYDSTGQNKITDTYGLNITVTMPIPDVLIQYGGNARVAAADNGNLQQLTPKFTTIDGIACISFVPPHFSPYVIYVDTNNLVAGQTLDSTPSTGDPIHPKWFAAIGMACISIILFATSDGHKRRKYRAA